MNNAQRILDDIDNEENYAERLLNLLRIATEHHHNTRPIEFDKFNFVCHKCHLQRDRMKGGIENDRENDKLCRL